MTIDEAKKKAKGKAKGKKKKEYRKGNPDYIEVPGGTKKGAVYIKKGTSGDTSDEYPDKDAVMGAIAGWIGRKHGKGAKMDAAGKKALAKARKGKKGKREAASDIADNMINEVMGGANVFDVLFGALDPQPEAAE